MQNRLYRLLTWIVLLLGLAGSGVAGYWIKSDIDTRAYQHFFSYCEEIQLKIAARLEAHEQVLLGGAALFEASPAVDRQEWHTYVDRLRLDNHFNGIQGLGFALWIPVEQLARHEATIRAEGFPDYKVHPEGEREAYSSIIFLEPFTDRNLRAFGYDMYSEPVRRAAMEQARDKNIVTLSERVTLVQESNKDVQAGSLMYVPVYKKGQPIDTIEQRRAALFGWVYSPFRMTDLLNNIVLQDNHFQAHLRIYDGQNTQAEHLFYDNNPNHSDTKTPHQHQLLVELTNNFNGTIWTLQFEKIIVTNSLDYEGVWITLSTGTLISFLLFLLSNSYLNMRVNAVKIATKLTRELKESESRFRILADNAPVLIWIIEHDKLCSHVNKVWLNFTGRTLEQELGNGWAEGVHADDLQRCMAVFISSFDAHLPFTTEYRLRRYDGEYRWLLDTGVPRFADDGSFLGYIGSCIDITDNKEAQIIIEKTSSLLQATLESSNEAILVVDFNNMWVVHNQNFIEMWHIPNEIVISNDDNAALSFILKQVEDAEGFLNKVFDLYNSPEASSFDIINFKNGKIIERYSIPQRINGKVVGRVWRFRDITERKAAEIAIAEAHTLLRSIIDTAPMRVFWKDSNLRYLGCNLAFAKDAGMNCPNDLIGKDDYQLGWQDQAELYRADDRAVLESGIAKLSYDEPQTTPSGQTMWLRTSKVVLKNQANETFGLLGIYEDITDYKRVEKELLDSQELLQTAQRIAMLAHYVIDLRDPTAITWTNDTLLDEIFGLKEDYKRNFANLSQIIHPDDLSLVEDNIYQALSCSPQNPNDFMEHRIIRPNDGEERWIAKWGCVFFDEQNNPIRQVGMIQDITKRKHLEEEVKASEQKFRSIIEISPVPMLLYDNQQNIIFLNTTLINTFGYELSDIPTVTDWWIKTCPNPNYRQLMIDAWQAELEKTEQEDQSFIPLEVIVKCKDGTQKTILFNEKAIIDYGYLVVFYDITRLKQIEQYLLRNQQQLQNIIIGTNAGTWEWNIQTGEVVFNERWANIIGYELAELQPVSVQRWLDLCHPDDLKLSDELLNKHFAGELDCYQCECRMKHKQGHWVWVSDRGRLVSSTKEGKPLLMAGTHIDISETKKIEAELRIAATVFQSQEGMMITDADEIILNVNKAFTQITGYSEEEAIGQTPRLLHSGRQDKEFYTAMWQSIDDTGAWQGELWNQRKNGDIYPEQLTITAVKANGQNLVTHYVATLVDITERKAMEDYIHRLAFYDVLTQLPNRRLLQERIKHGIELNHRTGNQMAVLMMDLDKFKAVNDTQGHAAGDELLQQVAERVKASLREVDMVARLGGDEFVIILENVSHYEHVAHVAQSIIDTLTQPFTLNQHHEVSIGASIGISICPQHGNTIETLMDNADTALYHAKDSGRGCFTYFSEALNKKAHERIALESRLHSAIEQQELRLYFQPQIEINSGLIVGAETLVYWNDSGKGDRVILKDFITLAEETGVAVAIGEWALRETCKLGRQWLDEGLPMVTLAVNISSYLFRCGDIKNLVSQILDETGLPPDYLGLEITETGLMVNQQHALSILNSLNTRSIQLAIDDFGTGYSSLSRLKSFPIDILKIDKTFINNIPFSQDDMMITTTIIDIAHHLDFKVLAEGVETAKQLTFLRQQGCDYYQGDLYSKALSAHDFGRLLRKS